MILEYWHTFITENEMIGCDFEISEDDDLSELGADLKIMSIEQCVSEATECHPGIEAFKRNYVPVAVCLAGSGDYYFIRSTDGAKGALYRIYHDAVNGESINENGIDKVLNSYASLV